MPQRRRSAPARSFSTPLALLVAALLATLVACTGTSEVRPPVLLAVGEGGAQPRLLLLEDTFASVASGSGERPEIRALAWSARALPGEPLALDATRAVAERDRLWVLTRDGENAFALQFAFDDIDLDAESGFAEIDAADRLRLDGPDGDPGLLDEAADAGPDTYCLVELLSSANGRYLALYDDRDRCGLSDATKAVYIVDTQERRLVASAFGVEQTGSAGIAVDQGGDLLYYLDPFELVAVDLRDGSPVASIDPADVPDTGAVRDLTLVEGAALLLRSDDFAVVPLDDDPAPGSPEAGLTETLDDAVTFVPDASREARALVLAGPDFAFHRTLDDADPFLGRSGSSGAVTPAATLEPVEGFAYFVRPGQVVTLDLIRVGTSLYQVPELSDPRVVAWGRALAVPSR